MTDNVETFVGRTVFTYSAELVAEIDRLLKCNNNDIVPVFEILWAEGKIRHHPDLHLRLIQRCQKHTDPFQNQSH